MHLEAIKKMNWLETLPEDVFLILLDYLPLSSIAKLAATCHTFHVRIHQNENYWTRKLRRNHQVCLLSQETFSSTASRFEGIIHVSSRNEESSTTKKQSLY